MEQVAGGGNACGAFGSLAKSMQSCLSCRAVIIREEEEKRAADDRNSGRRVMEKAKKVSVKKAWEYNLRGVKGVLENNPMHDMTIIIEGMFSRQLHLMREYGCPRGLSMS